MIDIKGFRAFRPPQELVHLVSSRSYVSYKGESLKNKLEGNPFSYIHIINPEHNLESQSAPFSNELFESISNKFQEFVDKGNFVQDEKESIYLYRQQKEDHVFVGLICLISVTDYEEGRILKHEETIARREERFMRYLDITNIHAEPVLLTYPDIPKIEELMQDVQFESCEYNFTTVDEVNHKLWPIHSSALLSEIQEEFQALKSVYIADGHHRCASSALLSKHRYEKGKTDASEYFMCMLIPESHLHIVDFNRVVKGLNGQSQDEFMEKLNERFLVSEIHHQGYQPTTHHEIGMYMNSQWYRLEPSLHFYDSSDPVEVLDAHILSKNILEPILGIADLKTDDRVRFISGTQGVKALEEAVDSGKYDLAFNLFPVDVAQLKDVADAGKIMPPKTTWIEPKLRSGLTVFSTKSS